MIEELKQQLPTPPGMVVATVGGGGLLSGVFLGLEKVGWFDKVAVVAIETEGAASFNACVRAGKIVKVNEHEMRR